MKLIKIVRSQNPEKKYDAVFDLGEGKTKRVSFGAAGMSDYIHHKDPERRMRYIRRHRGNEDWENPLTPGALSRWILWEDTSFERAVARFRRRFSL